ncbi:hypothetical protein G6F65_022152 [Rhizopus arrhizus]|nr:hypothetical protein G6F65_022152 [Rhizopus arrhizus]
MNCLRCILVSSRRSRRPATGFREALPAGDATSAADAGPLAEPFDHAFVEAEAQAGLLVQHHASLLMGQLAIDQLAEVQHLVVPEEFHCGQTTTP